MIEITERRKKSEKLTPEVKKAFKKWIVQQGTKVDAAKALGLSRANLDRIDVLGSCSPATAIKIKEVLNNSDSI